MEEATEDAALMSDNPPRIGGRWSEPTELPRAWPERGSPRERERASLDDFVALQANKAELVSFREAISS